jgi:hypothetical protein
MSGTITKLCTQCHRDKPLDSFPLRTKKYREAHPDFPRNSKCRDCVNSNKRFERKLRPPSPEQELNWRLREKYGLDLKEYEECVAAQNGLCAICKNEPIGERLVVDHCHEGKFVRGLLCVNCNIGLGHFQDDPIRLMAAIGYLGDSYGVV